MDEHTFTTELRKRIYSANAKIKGRSISVTSKFPQRIERSGKVVWDATYELGDAKSTSNYMIWLHPSFRDVCELFRDPFYKKYHSAFGRPVFRGVDHRSDRPVFDMSLKSKKVRLFTHEPEVILDAFDHELEYLLESRR